MHSAASLSSRYSAILPWESSTAVGVYESRVIERNSTFTSYRQMNREHDPLQNHWHFSKKQFCRLQMLTELSFFQSESKLMCCWNGKEMPLSPEQGHYKFSVPNESKGTSRKVLILGLGEKIQRDDYLSIQGFKIVFYSYILNPVYSIYYLIICTLSNSQFLFLSFL